MAENIAETVTNDDTTPLINWHENSLGTMIGEHTTRHGGRQHRDHEQVRDRGRCKSSDSRLSSSSHRRRRHSKNDRHREHHVKYDIKENDIEDEHRQHLGEERNNDINSGSDKHTKKNESSIPKPTIDPSPQNATRVHVDSNENMHKDICSGNDELNKGVPSFLAPTLPSGPRYDRPAANAVSQGRTIKGLQGLLDSSVSPTTPRGRVSPTRRTIVASPSLVSTLARISLSEDDNSNENMYKEFIRGDDKNTKKNEKDTNESLAFLSFNSGNMTSATLDLHMSSSHSISSIGDSNSRIKDPSLEESSHNTEGRNKNIRRGHRSKNHRGRKNDSCEALRNLISGSFSIDKNSSLVESANDAITVKTSITPSSTHSCSSTSTVKATSQGALHRSASLSEQNNNNDTDNLDHTNSNDKDPSSKKPSSHTRDTEGHRRGRAWRMSESVDRHRPRSLDEVRNSRFASRYAGNESQPRKIDEKDDSRARTSSLDEVPSLAESANDANTNTGNKDPSPKKPSSFARVMKGHRRGRSRRKLEHVDCDRPRSLDEVRNSRFASRYAGDESLSRKIDEKDVSRAQSSSLHEVSSLAESANDADTNSNNKDPSLEEPSSHARDTEGHRRGRARHNSLPVNRSRPRSLDGVSNSRFASRYAGNERLSRKIDKKDVSRARGVDEAKLSGSSLHSCRGTGTTTEQELLNPASSSESSLTDGKIISQKKSRHEKGTMLLVEENNSICIEREIAIGTKIVSELGNSARDIMSGQVRGQNKVNTEDEFSASGIDEGGLEDGGFEVTGESNVPECWRVCKSDVPATSIVKTKVDEDGIGLFPVQEKSLLESPSKTRQMKMKMLTGFLESTRNPTQMKINMLTETNKQAKNNLISDGEKGIAASHNNCGAEGEAVTCRSTKEMKKAIQLIANNLDDANSNNKDPSPEKPSSGARDAEGRRRGRAHRRLAPVDRRRPRSLDEIRNSGFDSRYARHSTRASLEQ